MTIPELAEEGQGTDTRRRRTTEVAGVPTPSPIKMHQYMAQIRSKLMIMVITFYTQSAGAPWLL